MKHFFSFQAGKTFLLHNIKIKTFVNNTVVFPIKAVILITQMQTYRPREHCMKISWFKKVISPETGAYLAGYSTNDKSVARADDLYMHGLLADDGVNRVLIISFDLLGLDWIYIKQVREKCAALLKIPVSNVLFTCTHTHSGPETRSLARKPDQLNTEYLHKLETMILDAVKNIPEGREAAAYFYSSKCDENRNRRYTTGCNRASFTAYRRDMAPLATEYADKELGELIFLDPANALPLYVIGNYGAHPLAGHAPGLGGLRISSDYPGAECMFISGAAGDLVPKEDECGLRGARLMGENLAKAAISGMVDAQRNPGRFKLDDKLGAISKFVKVPLRKHQMERIPASYNTENNSLELEIQVIAVGDICFIGVPGELCCELGQEMKWHSPFRRTWIAYNATAYCSYIGHANMLVSGGYEGASQWFTARGGLMLLNAAADAMFELRETLYCSDGDDIYPDCLKPELVNIPPNQKKTVRSR